MPGAPPRPPPRETRPRAAAALAALTLLGLLAPLAAPPGAAQFTPQADLEVRSLDVPQPRVNQSINLTAVLKNHGPADALSLSVVFGYNNATQPLAGDSTVNYPQQQDAFTEPTNATGGPDAGCLGPLTGLRSGCSVKVRYAWTPPEEKRGPANVTATAQVGATLNDPLPANDVVFVPVFIIHHRWALTLEAADDHGKQTRPGEAAFYRLTVVNRGNTVDEVLLRAASEQWAGAAASTPRATLAPGDGHRFLALLVPVAGDAAVARANVTANATAAPDLGSARRQLPDTSRVDALGVNFAYRPEPPGELFVASGGTSNLSLPVRNTGGSEDALAWSVASAVPAAWNVTFPEPWVGLDGPAGALTQVPLRVATNASLLPGASLTVVLNATSRNGAQAANATLTLRTAAADLELRTFLLDRDAVYAGDRVLLTAEVRNLGLAPMPKTTRLAVEATNATGRASVGEALFGGLAPGEARILALSWATGGLSGAYDLTARVDPDGELPETHDDNNNLTRPVVVRLHGLTLEAPAAREVRPSEPVAFEGDGGFRVRNLGNAPEEVVVVLGTDHGWGNATERVHLAPGEAAAVRFAVQVPALPGTLREAVHALATLANRSATQAGAVVNLTVADREGPLLVRLDAPAFVELGTAAEVQATLRDAVGVREATLHLRQPDATLRAQALEQRGPEVWGATLVLTQPGAVSYWVTAVDATPANNTLDTSTKPQALLVGVRSAPLVELLEPRNNSVIRSGRPILLRITDIHGVGEVTVLEGGRVFSVESPYTIRTAGLAEGAHAFDIVARNRYGNPTTERFVFTVDDTPPRVQDGAVEPARPAPGQEFRVAARASQDATLAVVQVLRDGIQLREVPGRVGLGEVGANLTIAEAGRYVLAVRVEDAAGNVATLDLPVEVGGGVPGPGLGAALLALLGAAAVAARRRRGRS